MKLHQLGSNQTEVQVNANLTVFFSYQTPVACHLGKPYHTNGPGYYRTRRKWSVTTSKHINKWLGGVTAAEMPQDWFDKLVEG